jgi:hypothetical protein
VSKGSSETYSKLRPLRGSRMRFAPPASITLNPYVDGRLPAYVDGRLPARVFVQCSDQIACVHMSGLLLRSHMNAGQDGFRDASSKHGGDFRCQWIQRSILRLGSIDHTICSLPCKFWHRLSTVAGELLPVSG